MKKSLLFIIIGVLLIVVNLIVLTDLYGATLNQKAYIRTAIIVNVKYLNMPYKTQGYNTIYRQEVEITFTDGILQVPRNRILNDIIPLGKVEIIKDIKYNNEYYATYRFIKLN